MSRRTQLGAVVAVALCLVAGGCGSASRTAAVEGRPTGQVRLTAPAASVSVVPLDPPGQDAAAPYAWINGPYVTRVGRAIELDGSGSYARDGALLLYEWDFDGDGAYDEQGATPRLVHRFTTEYSGVLMLRVTNSSGRQQTATTHLAVSRDGDEVPTGEDNCPRAANPGQEDEDGDGIGDLCDDTPGWPTQDAPGVTEGVG